MFRGRFRNRQVANDRDLTVALDVTITEELSLEGLAREIVNRVQNLRKNSGYEVTDRIEISLSSDDKIAAVIEAHGDYIMAETLGNNISLESGLEGDVEELNDGVSTVVKVHKI